jgi:hypothetical protein
LLAVLMAEAQGSSFSPRGARRLSLVLSLFSVL